jgi:hypothetical protein
MWPNWIDRLTPCDRVLRTDLPKFITLAGEDISMPVRLVALLGTSPTGMYADCPNLPLWHIENAKESTDPSEYFDLIGRYYWCDVSVIYPPAELLALRLVFNEGDADCNDGLWGEVWQIDNGKLIANITSTGDCEASIEVISQELASKYENLELPAFMSADLELDPLPCESIVPMNDGNLEKILTLAIRLCCVYRNDWAYENYGYDLPVS